MADILSGSDWVHQHRLARAALFHRGDLAWLILDRDEERHLVVVIDEVRGTEVLYRERGDEQQRIQSSSHLNPATDTLVTVHEYREYAAENGPFCASVVADTLPGASAASSPGQAA